MTVRVHGRIVSRVLGGLGSLGTEIGNHVIGRSLKSRLLCLSCIVKPRCRRLSRSDTN